jgi:hypothetical protein
MRADRTRFRVWDLLKMEMIGPFDGRKALAEGQSGLHPSSCDWVLMQSTGMCDCQHQEVFEGDVITDRWRNTDGLLGDSNYRDLSSTPMVVHWNSERGQWFAGDWPLADKIDTNCVVTNIHMTPTCQKPEEE